MTRKTSSIVLGGGCFWCTEALFTRMPGVLSAEPGYAGGHTDHPTYDDVCRGGTGHAEVVRVTFDPDAVPLSELLVLFFALHDPTTRHRQGADVGEQYRSIILWTDNAQKEAIAKAIWKTRGLLHAPIVTEVEPLASFYPAEMDHRQYYEKDPRAPYCQTVIEPKLKLLRSLLSAS